MDRYDRAKCHRTKVEGTYILAFTSNFSMCEKFKKHWGNYITCSTEYELMAKNWKSEI